MKIYKFFKLYYLLIGFVTSLSLVGMEKASFSLDDKDSPISHTNFLMDLCSPIYRRDGHSFGDNAISGNVVSGLDFEESDSFVSNSSCLRAATETTQESFGSVVVDEDSYGDGNLSSVSKALTSSVAHGSNCWCCDCSGDGFARGQSHSCDTDSSFGNTTGHCSFSSMSTSSEIDSSSGMKMDVSLDQTAAGSTTLLATPQSEFMKHMDSAKLKKLKNADTETILSLIAGMPDNSPYRVLLEAQMRKTKDSLLDTTRKNPKKIDRPRVYKASPCSAVKKNNKTLDRFRGAPAFPSQDGRLKIIEAAALKLKKVKDCTAYDTHHSQIPEFSYDSAGEVKKVLGGHDMRSYDRNKLNDSVFVGANGEFIGVCIEGKIPKTVQFDYSEEAILTIAKKSSKITQPDGNLQVRQFGDTFYGEYVSDKSFLIRPSIFPLLTVHDPVIKSENAALIGSFGSMNSNYEITPGAPLTISKADFDVAVSQGKSFIPTRKSPYIVTDITNYLDVRLSTSTSKKTPIFAITPKKP